MLVSGSVRQGFFVVWPENLDWGEYPEAIYINVILARLRLALFP